MPSWFATTPASSRVISEARSRSRGPVERGPADLAVDITGPGGGNGPDSVQNPLLVPYTLTVTNVGGRPSAADRRVRVSIDSRGTYDVEFDACTPHDGASGGAQAGTGCNIVLPAIGPGDRVRAGLLVDPVISRQVFFSPLELLGPDDVLVLAELQDSSDPASPGANEDNHVTVINPPRNDSGVTCPTSAPREAPRLAGGCGVRARGLRRLSGTASGDVARVEIAMVRTSGGARTAAPRCRWLTAKGRLKTRPPSQGRCVNGQFVSARGKTRWRLRLRRRLPRGSYTVYSRAISADGGAESAFSNGDGNRLQLRLR